MILKRVKCHDEQENRFTEQKNRFTEQRALRKILARKHDFSAR